MGRIGRPQQRYDVLPAPVWDIADLIAEWRTDAPLDPVHIEPADSAGTGRDEVQHHFQSAEPDEH